MKGKVLIAEDEPAVVAMLSEVFEEAGFEIVAFDTADAACAQLHEHIEDLILLFTDVKMPGEKTGLDLVFAARKVRSDLPIVVSSGYFEGTEQQISQVTWLPKPWTLGKLMKVCGLDPS